MPMNDADLDAALVTLRDSMGDLSTLTNIILGLRRSADRLMEPMTTVLIETRDAINTVLQHLETRS
jgi:hypothetical protein